MKRRTVSLSILACSGLLSLTFLLLAGCTDWGAWDTILDQAGSSVEEKDDEKKDEDPDEPIHFGDADLTANWMAYNDCVGASAGNVTSYGTFGAQPLTGLLVKFSDGTDTTVTVELTAANLDNWGALLMPDPGTDAHDAFNGIVNLDPMASYDDSAFDWNYEVTFTGLDPAKSYAFVATANRDDVAYTGTGSESRWTKFSLTGADTSMNISSQGISEVSKKVLKMNTGYNTENGYVVAWTDITAADGSVAVRSENVGPAGPGEENKSYGFQAFMFVELVE